MTLICGIDEAGRGPIIGPMVLAGVLIDEKKEKELKALGVKDSKLLSPAERENLFVPITKLAQEFKILIVPAEEIDSAVFGKDGLNLNRLEAKKTAEILNALRPDCAYIDSPSTNLPQYRDLINSQLDFSKIKLITEHKADLNYPVAAAASILAKVTRDREIKKIREEIGIDFGSGYLSDPKTAAFFDKHYAAYPHLFRKSWVPYQKKMGQKFQSTLENFSAPSPEESPNAAIREKFSKLESMGYIFVPTTSEHEELRMKGECTITLYKNGNFLVQGGKMDKLKIEKILSG